MGVCVGWVGGREACERVLLLCVHFSSVTLIEAWMIVNLVMFPWEQTMKLIGHYLTKCSLDATK